MEDSVKQRLKTFIKASGLKVKEFERRIGASNGYVNNISRSIGLDYLNIIGREFPNLNREWLLYNKGEMLLHTEDLVQKIGMPTLAIQENLTTVRFFSVTPTATFQEFCAGASENPDTISIIQLDGDVLDNTACVFQVSGNSMAPQIQSGAKILCNEIPPTKWHTLRDGVIVIAYGDKFVIKRIITNNLDNDNYIVLGSDNSDYSGTYKAALSDIRCIFRAVRVITQPIN